MNTILKIDFHKKKLIKTVTTKKELRTHEKTFEKEVEQFLRDMKEGLSMTQYITVLEGIISAGHYKKIKSRSLLTIIADFFKLT